MSDRAEPVAGVTAQAPVGWLARARLKVFSDGSLTKRASLNAVVAMADFGGRVVVGLLVTPMLVTHLGSFLYGVWQVLQRLLGHAAVATGRPGEALKWVVASKQASTDYEDKRRQVGNAIVVWLIFLPFLTVIGAVLSWYLPEWLKTPASEVATVRVASGVVVLNFIVLSLAYLPESVLHGENLAYKRLGLSTGVVLLGGVFTVVAIQLDTGLVGVAVALLATTLVSGAMYLKIAREQVAWFGVAKPLKGAVRQFIGLSWWFMLWNLVMQMMRGADFIVLGIAGSAQLVTVYSLTRFIPEAVNVATATLIFAAMPGLGGLIGKGERAHAAEVRDETMAFTWLLSVASGATILLWEQSFLAVWVGPGYYPGTVAMLLIVVLVLQFAIIRTDSNVIDLTLELRDKVLLGLLSAAVSVALGWVLLAVYDLGIAGLVAGFIAGRMIQSVAYPLMIGRLLGVRVRTQVRGAVRPLLVTALVLAAATLLGTRAAVHSWLALFAVAAATMLASTAVSFLAGLPGWQRRAMVNRARRVAQLT